MSGFFRYFAFFESGDVVARGEDDGFEYNMEALLRLQLDARTQTEYGTLRGFAEWQYNFSGTENGGNNTVGNRHAFVQFGGLTAGQTFSFFRPGGTSDLFYRGVGSEQQRIPLIAYTYVAGNGISATLSLEDPNNSQTAVAEFDDSLPSVVANVRVDQSWGSAQLSGAYVDNDNLDAGFAVRGYVSVNVMEAGALAVSGAYSDGADYYLGGYGTSFFGGDTAEAWAVWADYSHKFTSKLRGAIRAGYYVNDDADSERFDIGGTLQYTPVSGLDFGLEVYYADSDAVGVFAGDQVDGFYGVFRVNRSF
jgi:hypothetical protein